MELTLIRNWWALLVRGLLALAFGLIAWTWPGLTLSVLIILFGAYAFADGIFAIVSAVRAVRRHERWWPVAIEGALGIAVGVITFFVPTATAFALLVIVAAWALATGVLELIAAVRLRKHIRGEWLLALSGVLSIAFGVLLLLRPAAGLLAMVWLIAAYAIVYGCVMVGLSIRLKRHLPEERAPLPTGVTPQRV
jgi:uncharacterized membrane protein HdeD (DUF308 family)